MEIIVLRCFDDFGTKKCFFKNGNIAALSLQCQASRCRTDFADTSYPLEKVASQCYSQQASDMAGGNGGGETHLLYVRGLTLTL